MKEGYEIRWRQASAQTENTWYAIFAVQQNLSKMAATLHLQNSKEL